MKVRMLLVALLAMTVFSSLAFGQYSDPNQNRRRLGILGGLAGAAAGAVIGEDKGDAVPGALIGGAIGAVSGIGVGSAIDSQEQRNQYYQGQMQAQVQAQRAQAVTMADVVSMSQAGLGDAVIINHIQTHGVARPVSASDLIVLKQQGVSDPVLSAMQSIPAPTTVIRQPTPVIVEEYYYGRPAPWCYGHPHYYHYHRRPHNHVHFGVRVGH